MNAYKRRISMAEIRRLGTADAEDIAELFGELPPSDERSDRERLMKYINGRLTAENAHVIGLFSDNVLVGAALGEIVDWFMGPELYIHDIPMKDESMKDEFTAMLESYAKENGAETVCIAGPELPF